MQKGRDKDQGIPEATCKDENAVLKVTTLEIQSTLPLATGNFVSLMFCYIILKKVACVASIEPRVEILVKTLVESLVENVKLGVKSIAKSISKFSRIE